MFTGIVETVGRIIGVDANGDDCRLRVDCGALDLADTQIGDSISVNGVCLSAVMVDGAVFAADVSRETLSCTTLSGLASGSRVNLERALLPTTRLGGHLVSGHVDAVATVVEVVPEGQSQRLHIAVPPRLARYIAAKGSICVDGVSLTVNTVTGNEFCVNIIPHTLAQTVIGDYRADTRVNIEVDVIARYLERLLSGDTQDSGGIDREFLKAHGYIGDDEFGR